MRTLVAILVLGVTCSSSRLLAQSNLFNFGGSYHAGWNPRAVAVADLNNDGNQDLIIANYGSNNVTILLGNGKGEFTEPAGSPFAAGREPTSVAVGDFNGDNRLDLAIAPQVDMLHHRRLWFLLTSTKNQPHAGHAFTRRMRSEVSSSTAASAIRRRSTAGPASSTGMTRRS